MLSKLLTSRLQTILQSDYDSVIEAFSHERKGSFRINTLKGDGNEVFFEFEKKGIKIEKFEEIQGAYFFDRKDEYALKGTDAFYGGKIYLQSLSSMLPVLALEPQEGEVILDVCAAPGSKTTQMAMIMKNEGSIVALEQNQIRYDKLVYNTKLQGTSIIEGIKIDAKKYFSLPTETLFDRILLDAPCSAEGRIFLSNEKSYGFWTLENITKKAELQYELLALAFEKLKKGGSLVYSTCTLAPEENEGVVSRLLRSCPDAKLDPVDIGLLHISWWRNGLTSFGKMEYEQEMNKAVRILPSHETEGFFMVKIMKK